MVDPEARADREQACCPPDNASSEKEQTGAVSGSSSTEQDTIELLAEELSVGQRQVETGRVRVNVVTREREELIDMPLTRERVVVERVPVGKAVDAIPAIREDGDTIIVPVLEEILIVERRLMLKEELYVKRVRTTEQYREPVTLRRQEALRPCTKSSVVNRRR